MLTITKLTGNHNKKKQIGIKLKKKENKKKQRKLRAYYAQELKLGEASEEDGLWNEQNGCDWEEHLSGVVSYETAISKYSAFSFIFTN